MFPGKFWLYGLAALAVVSTVTAATLHYRGLLRTIDDQSREITALEVSLGEQRLATQEALNAADSWQVHLDRFDAELDALAELRQEARDDQRELRETLRPGRLRSAAEGRPELVEGIVNRGTERSRRVLECASGASGSCEPGTASSPAGDDAPPGP